LKQKSISTSSTAFKANSRRAEDCYVLCEIDDKNYDEIALITNVPVGTVRSRIFRARKFLMENIKI